MNKRCRLPLSEQKIIAFHEAGHVAAQAFFAHEWSHIVHVTIEANQVFAGHLRNERSRTPFGVAQFPPHMWYELATIPAICILAGTVAESIHTGEKSFGFYERAEEVVVDAHDFLTPEIELPGTDSFMVEEWARLVRRPLFPEHRIIRRWSNLTLEMLNLPQVWAALGRFAGVLLKERTVSDWDKIEKSFSDIGGLVYRLPRWRRRLRSWKATNIAPQT